MKMCIETRNGMKNNKSDKSSTVKQSNNKKVIDKNNNDKYEAIKLEPVMLSFICLCQGDSEKI